LQNIFPQQKESSLFDLESNDDLDNSSGNKSNSSISQQFNTKTENYKNKEKEKNENKEKENYNNDKTIGFDKINEHEILSKVNKPENKENKK